jgi:phosphohistidine phosphatase
MKKLFVLRHAKSSWADPDLADFDRPLNGRGVQAAPFMGSVIEKEGLSPDLILSSPAERAKTTAELVKKGGQLSADIRFEDRIYEASPQTLLQIASSVDADLDSVMFVGHNPGIEGFIRLLTGVHEPMPTAALAVIDLRIESWNQIAAGCGKLIQVIRPKDRLKSFGTTG